MSNVEHTLPTITEVAEWLGLPYRTVYKWPKSQPDADLGKQGSWKLRSFARLAIRLSRDRNRGALVEDGKASSSVRDKIALAELELTQEKAREKARQNRIAEGTLLQKEDVDRFFGNANVHLRETIMAIPDAVARSMPPDHREFVRGEVSRLCRGGLLAYRDALRKNEHNTNATKPGSDRPADSAGRDEQP